MPRRSARPDLDYEPTARQNLDDLAALAARNVYLPAPSEIDALVVALRPVPLTDWLLAVGHPDQASRHMASWSCGGAGEGYWYDSDSKGIHVRVDYGGIERLIRWRQLVTVMVGACTDELLADARQWMFAWNVYHGSQPPYWLNDPSREAVREANQARSLHLHQWANRIEETLRARAIDHAAQAGKSLVVQGALF